MAETLACATEASEVLRNRYSRLAKVLVLRAGELEQCPPYRTARYYYESWLKVTSELTLLTYCDRVPHRS